MSEEILFGLEDIASAIDRKPEHQATCVFTRDGLIGPFQVKLKVVRVFVKFGYSSHLVFYVAGVTAERFGFSEVDIKELVRVDQDWEAQEWALLYWQNLKTLLPATDEEEDQPAEPIPF